MCLANTSTLYLIPIVINYYIIPDIGHDNCMSLFYTYVLEKYKMYLSC
jgi:hypothetical protein